MYYNSILEKASLKKKDNAAIINFLKKKKPSDLDLKVREFHDTAFSQIDCLLYHFGLRNSPKEYFEIQKWLILESNVLDLNILRIGIMC